MGVTRWISSKKKIVMEQFEENRILKSYSMVTILKWSKSNSTNFVGEVRTGVSLY